MQDFEKARITESGNPDVNKRITNEETAVKNENKKRLDKCGNNDSLDRTTQ